MDTSTTNLLIYLGVSLASFIISECMALFPSVKGNGILHYVALCLDIYKETSGQPLINGEVERELRRRASVSRRTDASTSTRVVEHYSETPDQADVSGQDQTA